MHSDKQFDDRLSAYLDGELSAEEAAQLERELSADSELRQLRDDLLALRGELQALPTQRPSGDLTSRILAAVAEKQREAAEPAVTVTVKESKKPLPVYVTFGLGMLASAALMLLALSLFQGSKPDNNVAIIPNDPSKPPIVKNRGQGEYDGQKENSLIATEPPPTLNSAESVPEIAALLQGRANQAGMIHVLRLQLPAGPYRSGALDKALMGQNVLVSGVLDRKEIVPHVALAYRSLPQARLIAGGASEHHPLAEIIYLELPADRVADTLTALATAPTTGKLAPEVHLATVPKLIEVASARPGNTNHAVGEDDQGTRPAPQQPNVAPNSYAGGRPFAIRIGAKQLRSALGDSVQDGEFAGPQDDQVDVLLFVRVQPAAK